MNDRELKRQQKDKNRLYHNLIQILSHDEFKNLLGVSSKQIEKVVGIKKIAHLKKLSKLGIAQEIHIPTQNIDFRRKQPNAVDELLMRSSVFNDSNRTLTTDEILVLNKGLKFGIMNEKVVEFEILANF